MRFALATRWICSSDPIHLVPLTQRFLSPRRYHGLYKYASPLVLAHLCPMDYSTFMSSGLQAIAPRHAIHRRSQSASPMTVRPLPPIPAHPPAYRTHARATSLDFRRADVQQRPSGPRGTPQRAATEGDVVGGRRPTPTGTPGPGTGGRLSRHRSASDDASSSYLSLDDSDSDSDSLPDELQDDIHATFIDLNESSGSLPLPQLVLPDSPHEGGAGLIKTGVPRRALAPPLGSFLSFTPAASPIDSPILALPSQHFLRSPRDAEPAVSEGASRHLDSKVNQFERELVSGGEAPDPPDDWRQAVDSFIGEEDTAGNA